MSRLSPFDWQDGYSTHYEISIRTEYTRFACMFYLFTFFAFFTTIVLFLLAHQSYHDESETIQRRFLPYAVLATISLLLCGIFSLGSFVYTQKFLRARKCSSLPSNRFDDASSERVKEEPSQPFILNTDESYYASTKLRTDPQTKTPTTRHYQTDV